MTNRREFFKKSVMAGGALAVSDTLFAGSGKGGQKPKRFIFIRKSNGTIPSHMVPPSFSDEDKQTDRLKGELDIKLEGHQLPAFMKPVESLQANTTIIQGLSGRMMKMDSHHPKHSCLALVNSTGEKADFTRASLDYELGKLLPSPFGHIGFSAAADTFGMKAGYSIKSPGLSNYVYCTPNVAYADIFGSVSSNHSDQVKFALKDELLKFSASRQRSKAKSGNMSEHELMKIGTYAESTEELVERSRKLRLKGDVLKQYAPKLEDKYFSNKITTSDKQIGHAEIAVAALITGVTNVVTLNMDDTQTLYPELGLEGGNVHDVGHNKSVNKVPALRAREIIREQHMKVVALMVDKLKQVPEGDGTMFDNTVVYYMTDCGEAHHSEGFEWPFVVFSGKNVNQELAGRYIRLPKYAADGHKTLGNFYTTILNSSGNPIEHYGSLDPKLDSLKFDQLGPIKEFLA